MFTMPFGVFFATKRIVVEYSAFDDFTKNILSVIAAVFSVHVIVFCYVFKAIKLVKEEAREAVERDGRKND